MSNSLRLLRLVLVLAGLGMGSALVAVFLPRDWMASAHEMLGFGSFPDGAVAEYLARLSSGLYALVGVLVLLLARRPRRYAGLIRFVIVAVACIDVVMLVYGLPAGVPVYWVASLAAMGVGMAVVVLVLLARVEAEAHAPR